MGGLGWARVIIRAAWYNTKKIFFSSEEKVIALVRRGFVQHGENRKERPSFSEEKEAKRLLFRRLRQDLGMASIVAAAEKVKVFWFFSSEKNIFT